VHVALALLFLTALPGMPRLQFPLCVPSDSSATHAFRVDACCPVKPPSWRAGSASLWIPPVRALIALLCIGILCISTGTVESHAQTQAPDQIDAPPELKSDLIEADSLRSAGKYREALAQLSTLEGRHPQNADVLYRLSLTRVDIGENADERMQRQMYDAALTAAQAAVEADSTNAYAHLSAAIAEGRVALMAGTREKIERSRQVKHHADRAIELDPDLSSAYHVRARWNREVADLGFFTRAIVRTVYGGLPDASFEQSVRDFQTAIEKEDTIVHHIELARTYLKMDREDDARKALETVLAMEVDDPDDPKHKRKAQELLDEIG
jgi:FimV-like protein